MGVLLPFQITLGEMPDGTLRAILKQAGIDPEDFLKA
jgi:hypothetical protein